MNRTDIINCIIRARGYSSYLEIGVMDAERNFNLLCCDVKVAVDPAPGELYTYLAVRGGFDVGPVLGSRSWDSLSRLGPEAPEPARTAAPASTRA